jgi:hypothetical protein
LAISLSVKDHAQSRSANTVSAYYPVARQDWGVLAPGTTGTAFSAGANLSASASGGSLATTTGAFKITWVTAIGESLPSVEATVSVTGATGSVTVSLASVGSTNAGAQLNAQPIIGWKIYSGSGSGNELANEAAASLSVALSTLTTQRGATLTYIPIATTSAVVKVYGAGAAPPVVNTSGIQFALPAITTNVTSDLFIKVPVPFNVARSVLFDRPNATADAAGISLQAVDCVAPLWAASTAFNAGDFIVVGNILFQCTVAGTTAAANAVPNFAGSAQYGTVTDNTATWTNLGRWHLLRLRFANLSGSTAQPTANEFNFSQL